LFASLWGIVLWNELLPPVAWSGMGLIVLGGLSSGILGIKRAPAVMPK